MSIIRFLRDQSGGPLVEAAILIPILFTFSLGAIDFLFVFYQWSAASKAVEVGARIAAVSDPVADGLNTIPTQALSSTVLVGNPMPDFQVTCDGLAASCTCTRGTCTGMGVYNPAAMNLIFFGRDGPDASGACNRVSTSFYKTGMCHILPPTSPPITVSNVKVVYTQTGLVYAGRAGGPVPTISVSLQNVPVQFYFLGGLLNFSTFSMPTLSTTHTITGEALSSGPA